jgi:hypothetical protein
MKNFHSSIVGQAIAALLAAGVLFFAGRITAPDGPSLNSEMRWIDVQNPFLRIGPTADLQKKFEGIFEVDIPLSAIDAVRFLREIRVGKLEIKNNGDTRTQQIELVSPSSSVVIVDVDGKKTISTESPTKIGVMNPNSSVQIYTLSPTWYSNMPFILLNDGRRIELDSYASNNDFNPFRYYVLKYPFLTFVLTLASAWLWALVFIWASIFIYAEYNLDFKARQISTKTILSHLALIEYVREKYPDKMPRNIPPSL